MSEPTNREPLTININRQCEVTLTEFGLGLYRNDYCRYGAKWTGQVVVGKPIRIQLWEIMRVFGPHIVFGNPFNPFEGKNIVLLPDTEAIRMEEIDARIKELESVSKEDQ